MSRTKKSSACQDGSLVFLSPMEKKIKKTRQTKEVKYPVFRKYMKKTDDVYWQNMLENASYGTFPKNFSYYDGTLKFSRGVKNVEIQLSEKSIEATKQFISFFQTYGNYSSITDNEKARAKELNRKEVEYQPWNKLNSATKQVYLSMFIESLKHKYELNHDEVVYLTRLLNLYKLKVEHVKLKNNIIKEIIPLSFDESTRKFDMDIPFAGETEVSDKFDEEANVNVNKQFKKFTDLILRNYTKKQSILRLSELRKRRENREKKQKKVEVQEEEDEEEIEESDELDEDTIRELTENGDE